MTDRQAAILITVGGGLVALGSVLPWATLTTGFGSISLSGIEGDGIVSLVLGGAIALLGFLAYGGTGRPGLAAGAAVITLAFGIWKIVTLSSSLAESESEVARASVGMGLYILAGGAVLALMGAWTMYRRRPQPAGSSSATTTMTEQHPGRPGDDGRGVRDDHDRGIATPGPEPGRSESTMGDAGHDETPRRPQG